MKITKLFPTYRRSYPAMATFQESLPLTISTELLLLLFFAHQPERGMSKEIWADLPNSKLTFFSAGSYELFEKQAPKRSKGNQKKSLPS